MPYSTACNTPLSNFEANQNYKDVIDPAGMFPSDFYFSHGRVSLGKRSYCCFFGVDYDTVDITQQFGSLCES
jgi:hypothetical protein